MICEISQKGMSFTYEGLSGATLAMAKDAIERVLPERGPAATAEFLTDRLQVFRDMSEREILALCAKRGIDVFDIHAVMDWLAAASTTLRSIAASERVAA
jgi:hypothetical protein